MAAVDSSDIQLEEGAGNGDHSVGRASQGIPKVGDSKSATSPADAPAIADGTLLGHVDEPEVRRSSFGRSASRLLGQPEKKEQGSDERTLYPRAGPMWANVQVGTHWTEGNKIRTTRFGKYNWLPLSIYYQMRRAANRYFIVITLLQMLWFSPKWWPPTAATFSFVLVWTACKDRYEDYGREKSDRAENTRPTQVLNAEGAFVDTIWEDVKLGDIVKVKKDEMFPTDMVVLMSSFDEGHCYIDTKNLDGETNLKYKLSAEALLALKPEKFDGKAETGVDFYWDTQMKVEAANENMHSFKGSFQQAGQDDNQHPLFLDHVILRGCSLRNTDWMVGYSVYTGPDTKAMLNSRDAPAKQPHLQILLNRLLYGLFGVLGLMVTVFGVFAYIWEANNKDKTDYLQRENFTFDASVQPSFAALFRLWQKITTFIITFSHLIPMSLYVALEVIKLSLALWIYMDEEMVDDEHHQSALARNSDLVEELGQVEIVFSDKTGTLTCNKMEFVRCSIAETVYGPANNEELKKARALLKKMGKNAPNHHCLGDETAFKEMIGEIACDPVKRQKLEDYFVVLACCHACVIDPDTQTYQGSSPDEVALVQGAAMCGVTLESLSFGEVKCTMPDGSKREYKIHEMIEFDSDRKRMSVMVEDKHNKKIELFMKGADMMVLERLSRTAAGNPVGFDEGSPNMDHINQFSSEGLRTLVVGKKLLKDLTKSDSDPSGNPKVTKDGMTYDQWKKEFHAASVAIEGREELTNKAAEKIENDLDYVGITAVEDMLQEGVPETIALLKQAGIRVWVLTGDKVETAIDIGYSCRLLDHDMNVCKLVNLTDPTQTDKALNLVLKEIEKGDKRVGLAMDGYSLTTITSSNDESLRKLFFDCVMSVDAVICCRVAPKQKAFVVKTVLTNINDLITASIGDGANDVAMIQEAHVGIGIRGVEGTQAVQASDFAISQFRFLQSLLLDHGRGAYRRVAMFMCYYFYKNIALVMCDAIYAWFNGYSGTILFWDWYYVFFNAWWTSFPCIFSLAFDRDVSPIVSRANAYLYAAGPNNVFFNGKIFSYWIVTAFWHGGIGFAIPWFAYSNGPVNVEGKSNGYMWCSVLISAILVTIINLKLCIITISWRVQTIFWLTISQSAFYLMSMMMGSWQFSIYLGLQWQVYNVVFDHLFLNNTFPYLPISFFMYISGVAFALFPDIIYEALRQNSSFMLNPLTIQMYHEREGDESACFLCCPPIKETHGQIVIRPIKPGTTEPHPVPRLTRKQWKMLKMKAKAAENKAMAPSDGMGDMKVEKKTESPGTAGDDTAKAA